MGLRTCGPVASLEFSRTASLVRITGFAVLTLQSVGCGTAGVRTPDPNDDCGVWGTYVIRGPNMTYVCVPCKTPLKNRQRVRLPPLDG